MTAAVDQVGVNTHVDASSYSSIATVVATLNDVGFRWVRDNSPTAASKLRKAGYTGKVHWVCDTFDRDMALLKVEQAISAGVWAIELLNEPPQGSVTAAQSKAINDAIVVAINGRVPVISSSIAIPSQTANAAALAGTSGITYGSVHSYRGSQNASQWTSYRNKSINLITHTVAPGKPFLITETGYSSFVVGNGTANDQILIDLQGWLSVGAVRVYFYELLDEPSASNDEQRSYGLADNDGTLKPQGVKLKGLLGGSGSTTNPTPTNIQTSTTPGQPVKWTSVETPTISPTAPATTGQNRPAPWGPLLGTDTPMGDPFDIAYNEVAHPNASNFSALVTLPKNFGRMSKDDPTQPLSRGLLGLLEMDNHFGGRSLMLYTHKNGSINDVLKGWKSTRFYWNLKQPGGTDTTRLDVSLAAQENGQYAYVGIDYSLTGPDGYNSRIHALYRVRTADYIAERCIGLTFPHPPDDSRYRYPAPFGRISWVTDTDPCWLFFTKGAEVWHMLDNEVEPPGYINAAGEHGQYGGTRWTVPAVGQVRPDILYLPNGNTLPMSGLGCVCTDAMPTLWPDLFIVAPHYAPAWTGEFDLYRVRNSRAGANDYAPVPGWPTDWTNHKVSKFGTLPGFDAGSVQKLTFRFQVDHRVKNTIWAICYGVGGGGSGYQSLWYAKSQDDGTTWGQWKRGPLASFEGDLSSAGAPIVTGSGDILMPLGLGVGSVFTS